VCTKDRNDFILTFIHCREGGHQYGKLNPAAVGSSLLASESESNFETSEKRTSCDFALWKVSPFFNDYLSSI
jgi:cysteinyl-tRNA synthetase